MNDRFLFTDDELVAMAADIEAPLPVTLPTVDTDNEESLIAAAVRGQRSLFVRGLAGSEGVDARVTWLQQALSTASRFSCFVGTEVLDRAVVFPATTWFGVKDGWVKLQEEALGTYSATQDSAQAALAQVKEWFDSALQGQPDVAGQSETELWICFAAVTGHGVEGLAARSGRLALTTIPHSGNPATESCRPDEFAATLDRIVRSPLIPNV